MIKNLKSTRRAHLRIERSSKRAPLVFGALLDPQALENSVARVCAPLVFAPKNSS